MSLLLTRHFTKSDSYVQIRSAESLVFLDFPAALYGTRRKLPSFHSPPRPLSFVVDRSSVPPDAIFITNPNSFGCLFVNKLFNEDIPIYMTVPVFEQLVMRYEEFSFSQVSYSDEDLRGSSPSSVVLTISDADLEHFKKNVIVVNFGEVVSFGSLQITSRPAGTFIGWSYLHISSRHTTSTSLAYVTSYSLSRRLAAEAHPIEAEYLLVNLVKNGYIHSHLFQNFPHHIAEVILQRKEEESLGYCKDMHTFDISEFDREITDKVSLAVIPITFDTLLLEILLHVCSLLESSPVPIFAVSPVAHKIERLVDNNSEWLNKRLAASKDSFPIAAYPLLRCSETLSCLNELRDNERAIVFYNDLALPSISTNQKLILLDGDFSIMRKKLVLDDSTVYMGIKLSMDEREIVQMFMLSSSMFGAAGSAVKRREVIKNTPYLITDNDRLCRLMVPHDTNVFDADTILTSGTLRITDRYTPGEITLSLIERRNELLETLMNSSSKTAIVDGDWIIVPEHSVKVKFEEEHIVFKRMESR